MKYHIVRLHAIIDDSNIREEDRGRAKGAWAFCKDFMAKKSCLIGLTDQGGQLFLASHEVLLQFLAGCPTDTAGVQIEVFSLSDAAGQLVPQDGTGDHGRLESYRISVSRED